MNFQKADEIIDIASWEKDPDYAPYPEGSRSKYGVISPKSPEFDFLVPKHRYLFKHSNSNFPEQFWAEVVAYIVGKHMGVQVPPAYAAVNSTNGECAALIEWFYGPALNYIPAGKRNWFVRAMTWAFSLDNPTGAGDKDSAIRYVPGGQYMVRLIPNYDLVKGRQHNFRTIIRMANALGVGKKVLDGIIHWARVFAFDALIGNTDRHQDNWGVIWYGIGPQQVVPEFAPAFDNGTALGHEILEENLSKFNEPEKLSRYINRGTHHVRWRVADRNRCQHFALIERLLKEFSFTRSEIKKVLSIDFDELESDLRELCKFELPVRFSVERCNFVLSLLKARHEILVGIASGQKR